MAIHYVSKKHQVRIKCYLSIGWGVYWSISTVRTLFKLYAHPNGISYDDRFLCWMLLGGWSLIRHHPFPSCTAQWIARRRVVLYYDRILFGRVTLDVVRVWATFSSWKKVYSGVTILLGTYLRCSNTHENSRPVIWNAFLGVKKMI